MFIDFGIRLKELREVKGLSQRELARLAGIADSYVGRLERKEVEPNHRVVAKLAQALTVDIDYFLEKEHKPVPLAHLSPDLKEFVDKDENIAWLTLTKEYADRGLTPEEIKEITDLFLKHKSSNK